MNLKEIIHEITTTINCHENEVLKLYYNDDFFHKICESYKHSDMNENSAITTIYILCKMNKEKEIRIKKLEDIIERLNLQIRR